MIDKGSLVQSKKGHDLGRVYLVVSIDSTFAMCVDGKFRVLENPKKKRIKHLQDLFVKNSDFVSKIEQNNIMEKPQSQEKLGPAQKKPIITTLSEALFLEHSGNKLDWISENDFYINGRYCIVKDIVIQTA